MQRTLSGFRLHVFLGGVEYVRAPQVSILSRRHAPTTTARIVIPDPSGAEFRRLAVGQLVEIRYGYRSQDAAVWSGSITGVELGDTRDQIAVIATGDDLPLVTHRVKQAYRSESPEAVMRHVLEQAGVMAGTLQPTGVVLPHVVVSNHTPAQIAASLCATLQRGHGIDCSRRALWLGSGGAVHWGDLDDPDQAEIPVVETGETLLVHAPGSSAKAALHQVETLLLSGFAHSMRFRLRDARRGIDEIHRALEVEHRIDGKTSRTVIRFGLDDGGYV